MGDVPQYDPEEFEIPGWFTPNRGEDTSPWGYEENRWKNRIVPDRIIRTFEGYGFDPDVAPEKDPNLYPSGVWRIDEVEYTADGLINITCRDIGSILADQILFPPIVPFHEYPLQFSTMTDGKNGRPEMEQQARKHVLRNWFHPTYDTDSNQAYVGKGITDDGVPVVQPSGAVRGHHGRHAFDGVQGNYWLSAGNLPNASSAYEFIQGKFNARDVYGVRVNGWGGPYRAHISVYADGEWKGRKKIPYRHEDKDATLNNNADIPFVRSFIIPKGESIDVKLPKVISNATKIRLTVTDLYNSGVGYYRYRAGIKNFEVSRDIETVEPGDKYVDGNYKDYSDIVRWLCAWGGFYWPHAGHRYNKFRYVDNTTMTFDPASEFDLFPESRGGNIWGVVKNTGTFGIVDHGIEVWDKKPILDGIKYVKDIVGFNFYIDENGGIVWRRPNIYEKNNHVYPITGGPETTDTTNAILIDEDTTLLGLSAKFSNSNLRERVFVANVNGKFGAVVKGEVFTHSHLRRVAGWTDENFENERECRNMAKQIALRQALTYREDNVIIPGNPAIQVDDQIRLRERVTGEQFRHYVKSISSDLDLSQGKWTYTMGTHWLGEQPGAKWWFDINVLDDRERAYLGLPSGGVTAHESAPSSGTSGTYQTTDPADYQPVTEPSVVVPVPPSSSEVDFYGHQPGKTYIGFSTDINYNTAISEIGADVDVYRLFVPTDKSKIGSCFTRSTKMVPWVSMKPSHIGLPAGDSNDISNWNAIAAGNRDTQIANMMDSLLSYVQGSNKPPMAFTFHHECIGPDRSAKAGHAYTAAFSRIIDIAKSRPTFNGRMMFAPIYEEFTFRQGTPPDWTAWCKSSFMDRIDFFGFDMYQFGGTNAQNGAKLRVDRIKTMLTQRGYPDMPLGVGECGGRQEAFGYDIDPSRYTSAQYGRQWVEYLKSQKNRFWIVSFYNATDIGNSRLNQSTRPPDTESYMDVYQDYLATGARLATIGIT
jgi:hypothetical protein